MTTFETASLIVAIAIAFLSTAMALIYRAQLGEMRAARIQSATQFELDSEPRFAVQSAKLLNFGVGQELLVDILMKNIGKLSAQAVAVVARLQIADLGFFPNTDYTRQPDASYGTTGNGEFLPVTLKGPPQLTAADYAAILNGTKELFAHGEVTWLSKIEPANRKAFRFCFQFDPEHRDLVICRPRGELQNEVVR